MKLYLSIFVVHIYILFMLINHVQAQVTYSGNLGITTQTEIDNFNYDFIDGELKIYGNEIKNLDGLITLDSVQSLAIDRCDSIFSLSGLKNLKTINDYGYISFCDNIISLDGLQSLSTVKSFTVSYCDKIESLYGLENVTTLEYLIIRNLNSIQTLQGLEGINKITQNLSITTNESLRTIEALSGIDSVRTISINYNNQLQNLYGLHKLRYLMELNIHGNQSLKNLSGLDQLERVGSLVQGQTSISGNQSMTSLHGAPNLQYPGFYFRIGNNNALKDLSGLESITELNQIQITSNSFLERLDGLENVAECRQRIEIGYGGVGNYGNHSLKDFSAFAHILRNRDWYVNHSSYSIIVKDNAYNPQYDNFVSNETILIEPVKTVHGDVTIQTQSQLNVFNYEYIEGDLEINDYEVNPIDNLLPLQSLDSIKGQLKISDNNSLQTLDGLGNILKIGEYINIGSQYTDGNSELKDFCDFRSYLLETDIDVSIQRNYYNPTLEQLQEKCMNTGPETFHITSPYNGQAGLYPEACTIKWNPTSDTDGDSIYYTVYFKKTSGTYFSASTPTGNTSCIVNNSWTNPNETYEAYVVASDLYNAKSYSDTISFSTGESNHVPTAPLLLLPENYSYDLSRAELKLTWEESTDEDHHSITYDIALGTSRSFLYNKIIASNIQLTSFIPDSLELDQTYYWMVQADDGYEKSAFSEVRSFKITHEGGVSNITFTESEKILTIYPNPSNGQITILNRLGQKGEILVHDLTGRLVLKTTIIDKEQSIDLQQAGGVYMISFQSENYIENHIMNVK